MECQGDSGSRSEDGLMCTWGVVNVRLVIYVFILKKCRLMTYPVSTRAQKSVPESPGLWRLIFLNDDSSALVEVNKQQIKSPNF